ncbi:CD3324 family protein [Sporomusa sphaeroides]|uniref:CD3324 family protein n=1 Tax=Sporomusa sphaeroides TaxID=47679 RepID=UPI002B938383|nr:CD3324 family protein [Sporomusa sphaeroides]HML33217.1 CD3324 family protein [Sporomusa sphaeroides]
MGYKNAICVLPDKLIAAIQEYIDGEYLYIPRKVENKKSWGELKNTRNFLSTRNKAIFVFCKRKFPIFAKYFPQAPVGNFLCPLTG